MLIPLGLEGAHIETQETGQSIKETRRSKEQTKQHREINATRYRHLVTRNLHDTIVKVDENTDIDMPSDKRARGASM